MVNVTGAIPVIAEAVKLAVGAGTGAVTRKVAADEVLGVKAAALVGMNFAV